MTKLMARLMWPSMIAAVTVASPAFAQAADEGFVDADEQQLAEEPAAPVAITVTGSRRKARSNRATAPPATPITATHSSIDPS